jgi:rare lipoprotein A
VKRHSFSYFLIIIWICACTRSVPPVRDVPPPSHKTVALPEIEKGKVPRPYVVNGQRYYPLPDAHGFVQHGKASWYGKAFHGRPTASGEIFDMHKKSAAHKILPMNTYVKVTNLSNRRYTLVRINDRGPFVKGRVIDLSYAAAKEIDLVGPGVADVKVVALGREVERITSPEGPKTFVEIKDLKRGEFTVQVGAFQDRENALELADRLNVLFGYVNVSVVVDEHKKTFYRVHVSKSKTLEKAGVIEKRLENMGFSDAFIVRI